MTLEDQIRGTVQRLVKARQEYFVLTYDEDSPQVLGPPATAQQLSALARKLGSPLPPTYAAFLRLHNGWLEWSGGARVLSTEEHDEPWVKKRMEQVRYHFKEFFDERVLDSAFVVILGEDEPDFVYLDKSKPFANGEFEVVHTDLIRGEFGRYPDFASFLEAAAESSERLVESARKE